MLALLLGISLLPLVLAAGRFVGLSELGLALLMVELIFLVVGLTLGVDDFLLGNGAPIDRLWTVFLGSPLLDGFLLSSSFNLLTISARSFSLAASEPNGAGSLFLDDFPPALPFFCVGVDGFATLEF